MSKAERTHEGEVNRDGGELSGPSRSKAIQCLEVGSGENQYLTSSTCCASRSPKSRKAVSFHRARMGVGRSVRGARP